MQPATQSPGSVTGGAARAFRLRFCMQPVSAACGVLRAFPTHSIFNLPWIEREAAPQCISPLAENWETDGIGAFFCLHICCRREPCYPFFLPDEIQLTLQI